MAENKNKGPVEVTETNSLLTTLQNFSKLYSTTLTGVEEKLSVIEGRLNYNQFSSLEGLLSKDGDEKNCRECQGLVREYSEMFTSFDLRLHNLNQRLERILEVL